PGDSKNFMLGQVRWLSQNANGDLHAGLRILPGLPAAVAVRATGLNAVNEKSVPALSVTAVDALNTPPALLPPAGWLQPTHAMAWWRLGSPPACGSGGRRLASAEGPSSASPTKSSAEPGLRRHGKSGAGFDHLAPEIAGSRARVRGWAALPAALRIPARLFTV